jgi:hypothetical protein
MATRDQLALRSLKTKLARAAAQAERGEFVDPDDVLKKIEALKKKRAEAAGSGLRTPGNARRP